jgi:3-isopropylmalate/(R)-2-methylmalate dehydratase small subunit
MEAGRDTVVGSERIEGRRAGGMEAFAFVAHTGRGAPLRRSAAVPDLLAGWLADPGLVLSRPEYEGATILISCPDFWACPAREHPASERAASALAGHGFLVVISARFDEVFRNNITKSGVFPLYLRSGKSVNCRT